MNKQCFVCKRKISLASNSKSIDNEIANTSGKPLKAVLQHLLKCTQIHLQIEYDSTLCTKCFDFLLDYDDHVVQLMSLQKRFKFIYENSLKSNHTQSFEKIIDSTADYEEVKQESNGEETLMDEDDDEEKNFLSDENLTDSDSSGRKDMIDIISTSATHELRTETENVKCSYCKLTFLNRSRLRKHVLTTHTKKEHFCTICGASAKDEEYLELHMNIHEGKTEYDCRFCEKRFNKKSNVIRHMHKHWDKKKYQCEKCGLRFSETPRLYNHKLLHEAEENPLICNICNQTCKTIRTYKRHMNTHREDRPRYPCHICGKTFSEKFTLKPHLRTHQEYVETNLSETKPSASSPTTRDESIVFVCVICNSSFQSKEQHVKHMETDHDVISWGA